MLHDALNSSIPQIFDTLFEDGKEVSVLNTKETEAAREKIQKLKIAFEQWYWTDADRVEKRARLYNDLYNNLVPR